MPHSMVKYAMVLIGMATCTQVMPQSIANYVNNGGFEECAYCTSTPAIVKPKYWDAIDTTKYFGLLLSSVIPPYLVPNNSFASQWPKSGNSYMVSSVFFKPFTPQTGRGYPRNVLKQKLAAGNVYCVKFYYNVTEQSSYGINSLGAYFGDVSTDTISQCMTPIAYLNPQISISSNIFIQDTAKWNIVSGTFTASGTEVYLMLGNFKGDNNTDTIMINPANLPLKFTDVLYDDVSCIDIDLPAYAGPDKAVIPGDSVYIGRESDVEIDESCIWYKLTSPTTSVTIDTVAGLYVKPVTTTTYVVRQQLWCSGVKWDTVVVFMDYVGIGESNKVGEEIVVFPNPASDEITISGPNKVDVMEITVRDLVGRTVLSRNVKISNHVTTLFLDLPIGAYIATFSHSKNEKVSKKILIVK